MTDIPPNSEAAERLAAFLVERRKARNLSQESLAALLGVSHGYVSHVEKGRRAISNDMEEKLCKVLDMNIKQVRTFRRLRLQMRADVLSKTLLAALADVDEAVRHEQL